MASKRALSIAEPAHGQLDSDTDDGRPCTTREPLASISDEHLLVDIREFWRTGACADKLVRARIPPCCLDLSCGHSYVHIKVTL